MKCKNAEKQIAPCGSIFQHEKTQEKFLISKWPRYVILHIHTLM